MLKMVDEITRFCQQNLGYGIKSRSELEVLMKHGKLDPSIRDCLDAIPKNVASFDGKEYFVAPPPDFSRLVPIDGNAYFTLAAEEELDVYNLYEATVENIKPHHTILMVGPFTNIPSEHYKMPASLKTSIKCDVAIAISVDKKNDKADIYWLNKNRFTNSVSIAPGSSDLIALIPTQLPSRKKAASDLRNMFKRIQNDSVQDKEPK